MILKKGWVLKLYMFIAFIIVGYIGLSVVLSNNSLSLFKDEIKVLNNEWQSDMVLEKEFFNLPKNINIPEDESIGIYKILGEDFKNEQTLLIRSSLSDLRVLLGSNELYKSMNEKEGLLRQPYASAWHLVTLPKRSNGEILKIEVFSPFKAMHGSFNQISYGNRGDLILNLLKENKVIVLTDVIIFFLGFVLVLFSLAFSDEAKERILSIGIFSIILSFWMLTETKMLQFFTGNSMIIGGSAYISLSLAAIPLIIYIKSMLKEDYKIFNFFIGVFLIDSLLIITLQLMDLKYFFDTMIFTHTIIGLLIIYILYVSYKSIVIKKERHIKYFVLGILILTVFSLIELIRFYVIRLETVSLIVRIGIILFVFINAYGIIKEFISHMERSYKSEVYKELAYKDALTGGKNRMAFQKEIKYLFKDKYLLNNICLIIFDLNNLKNINDEYGHIAGDQGIKGAYKCIEMHFEPLGKCYRIGGDEFACLIEAEDKETFFKIFKNFKKSIEKENRRFDFPFNIASGYVFYNFKKDRSPKEFIQRADREMYKDKYNQKNNVQNFF